MYDSRGMERNWQNFLSFWTIFCPLPSLTTQKNKILKKWKKKHLEILLCYTWVPLMIITWCMALEIWSVNDRIFLIILDCFFALLPPKQLRKSKFWKNEKITWRYYHFTHVYHKLLSYDVCFLRYGVQQTEFFVILDHFLPFNPLIIRKNNILKK